MPGPTRKNKPVPKRAIRPKPNEISNDNSQPKSTPKPRPIPKTAKKRLNTIESTKTNSPNKPITSNRARVIGQNSYNTLKNIQSLFQQRKKEGKKKIQQKNMKNNKLPPITARKLNELQRELDKTIKEIEKEEIEENRIYKDILGLDSQKTKLNRNDYEIQIENLQNKKIKQENILKKLKREKETFETRITELKNKGKNSNFTHHLMYIENGTPKNIPIPIRKPRKPKKSLTEEEEIFKNELTILKQQGIEIMKKLTKIHEEEERLEDEEKSKKLNKMFDDLYDEKEELLKQYNIIKEQLRKLQQ